MVPIAVGVTTFAITVIATTTSADPGGEGDPGAARAATARFHDLDTAEASGYALFKDAAGIACIDNPGVGGMGVHYVNCALVDSATIDAVHPQALVYEPTEDGLQLVAVEYVVLQAA